jgi:hypothetical protein
MNRAVARKYKVSLDKLRKAFKKLRNTNIYAYAKALDFDNSGCQALIQEHLAEKPDLRGGVYWNDQTEFNLEGYPVLFLGFAPRIAEDRETTLKDALKIAQETNQALIDSGLITVWNGCVCNTIAVVLDTKKKLDLEIFPCHCEKVWEMQFKQYMEDQLGPKEE